MAIIDCFVFYDELDILEIRLNSLNPYVNRFVLCEMPWTHTLEAKRLYFNENKERFKEFNITHLIAEDPFSFEWKVIGKHKYKSGLWKNEYYQREYLQHGIINCHPEDIILLSDLDEIPNLENYHYGSEGAFKQKMYYYYLNCFTNQRRWKGTIAIKKKHIGVLNSVRDERNNIPTIVQDGGWHFSHMGSIERLKKRISIKVDTKFATKENIDALKERRKNLIDPYARTDEKFTIEMPNGPKWLLENKDKYGEMFYGKI